MKILIDIGHPAHVHFFRNPIGLLKNQGHDILITSRDKEMALGLLGEMGLTHRVLSRPTKGGMLALGRELWQRDLALLRIVRTYRPDIMAGVGGIFVAQVGKVAGVDSLVFYDTENASLQNALTYPFASCVAVPQCYEGWLPKRRHIRYSGYHELSYLHPDWFCPDRGLAEHNGLAKTGDTFLVRLVAWQANHDLGERGWNPELLRNLVDHLSVHGKVLISSEKALPSEFMPYHYKGSVSDIHQVMAFCRICIGESATMASESAVLGVPAIYAAGTGRGYTNEQEYRYGLVRNVRKLAWKHMKPLIDEILKRPRAHWRKARERLLGDTIDVARFACETIEDVDAALTRYQHRG